MFHVSKTIENRSAFVPYRSILYLICCSVVTGCSTVPLADSLDWYTISGENETASRSARRHNALGIKWMNHGKLSKAETHFQKAIELSPRYAAPRNNLGNLLFARQELYLAAWQFERAAELDVYASEPLVNLGLVYEQARQLQRAEECYRRAIEISPYSPVIVGNLARILVRLDGDPAEIRPLLEQLLLIDTRPDWLDWADRLMATRYQGVEVGLLDWSSTTSSSPPLIEEIPSGGAYMQDSLPGKENILIPNSNAARSTIEELPRSVPNHSPFDLRSESPKKE
jgi:tetratricopeptide (TPR) repeat protein